MQPSGYSIEMLGTMRRWPARLFRSVLIFCLVAVTGKNVISQQHPPSEDDVRQVAAGIREAHIRLLHVKGGLGIRYKLEVEQDPKHPHFIWLNGLDGVLNIKWPMLRCRAEGLMSGFWVTRKGKEVLESRHHVREGNYNFETQASVAHDGNLIGQIVNFRHAWSSSLAFPLAFQCFSEADQFYVPGERFQAEYLLPEALEQHKYELGPTESVNGVPCRVLIRPGLDKIWVATRNGYVICRREFRFASAKPLRERTENSDLTEAAPGVWIPRRQIRDQFDEGQGNKRLFRLALRTTEIRVGGLQDKDVEVILDGRIAKIEDQITHKIYFPHRGAGADNPFDLAIEQVRDANLSPAGKAKGLVLSILLLNAVAVLAVCIFLVYRRRRILFLASQKQ